MRYVRLFLLHFQSVFQYRSRAFVWFLISLLNPLLILIFWQAALKHNTIEDWSFAQINSYYLLQVVFRALLWTQPAEEIAVEHIQRGGLVKYLLQPFSYLKHIFLVEISWRLLQGIFGISILLLFYGVFHIPARISLTVENLLVLVPILIGGICISFLYEMILGLSAFWLTDFHGLKQVSEVLLIVLTGTVLPLGLFPEVVRGWVESLPFAYILYFPILTLQGRISGWELVRILGMQLFWIGVLSSMYQLLWRKGIKTYSGVSI